MLRVRFERTNKRLTQTQVAVAAHIPQPALSLIELGRLIPTPEQLERLGAVFGVKPEDLLCDVAAGLVVSEAGR